MTIAIGISFGVLQHAQMWLWQVQVSWMLVPVLITALVVRREWQSLGVLSIGSLTTLGAASYFLCVASPRHFLRICADCAAGGGSGGDGSGSGWLLLG